MTSRLPCFLRGVGRDLLRLMGQLGTGFLIVAILVLSVAILLLVITVFIYAVGWIGIQVYHLFSLSTYAFTFDDTLKLGCIIMSCLAMSIIAYIGIIEWGRAIIRWIERRWDDCAP